VHQVPRRIDVVIFVAGVGECFAAMGCEADDQSCRKKGLHLASLGVGYRRFGITLPSEMTLSTHLDIPDAPELRSVRFELSSYGILGATLFVPYLVKGQ
jgi:hypothetical protein